MKRIFRIPAGLVFLLMFTAYPALSLGENPEEEGDGKEPVLVGRFAHVEGSVLRFTVTTLYGDITPGGWHGSTPVYKSGGFLLRLMNRIIVTDIGAPGAWLSKTCWSPMSMSTSMQT